MAALELDRMAKGQYAKRLQDVPGVVKTDLQDPYSGRSLVYRRQGQSYVLYSTGPDGRDNGGKGKDFPGSPGTDLVLWNGR
jgi:hypothetical protein